jgi:hypothetical protein
VTEPPPDQAEEAGPVRLLIERSGRRDFTRTLRVSLVGGAGPAAPPLLWVERPYHVLKEDALLYADEARERPLLSVRQRSAPAEGQTEHEILEVPAGRRFGALRGRAQSALAIFGDPLRWEILGEGGAPAGVLLEEGSWVRRLFLGESRFRIDLGLHTVALLVAEQGLLRTRFFLTLLPGPEPIEARFAVACATVAISATLRRRGGR